MFKDILNIPAKNINYDKLFEGIDSGVMSYLKNNNKLNHYVELKNKNWKTNDILWSIYNDIKLQYEFNNDYMGINGVFNHMGTLLFTEGKNALEYSLASFYISCYILDKKDYFRRLGTTKNREINTLLCKRELTIDLLENSINKLIPQYYNKTKVKNIYNFLKVNLK